MKLFLLILLFPSLLFAKTIKVAIIDSGLDDFTGVKICDGGLIDLTGTSMKSESERHGNNITHIISDELEKEDYCIYYIKVFADNKLTKAYFNVGIALAVAHKVDIINFSAGGPTPDIWEEAIITLALKQGIKFIAASGNYSQDLDKNCNYYPACYVKNGHEVIVVGNQHKSSNYGKKTVTLTRNGVNINKGGITATGSSQATAMYSRELLIKLLKEQKK